MGQQYGPFETRVQIIERSRQFVDLMIRNDDPNVTAYRIFGTRTLNDAYGNPTGSSVGGTFPSTAFVPNLNIQRSFRSPSIVRRRLGFLSSRAQLRKMSRLFYDPDDYASLPSMPSEQENVYIRVQEFALTAGGPRVVLGAVDTGNPILGPIVVVPPAKFFGYPEVPLILGGTAPGNTGAASGVNAPLNESMQVPNPMHIVLPRPGEVRLQNMDGVNDLLYTTGLGQPMATLAASDWVILPGGVKEILLAGDGATAPAFELSAVVNLGVDL